MNPDDLNGVGEWRDEKKQGDPDLMGEDAYILFFRNHTFLCLSIVRMFFVWSIAWHNHGNVTKEEKAN